MVSDRPIAAVVFDLDGVIRHWDPSVTDAIEKRHGLARGSIVSTGFSTDLGAAVVTGALTYEDWTAKVAARLGSEAAVAEWSQSRGVVDLEAVALVEEVRSGGCTVAVLSNATTRLEEDLAVLGIEGCFDRVFNTARLGVCKPDPAVYRRVLDELGLPGEQVAFTDDLPGWADAATQVGIHGIPFTDVPALRAALNDLGVRC